MPVSMEVKSGREVELWRYKQEWWDRENDFERIISTVPYDVDMQNFQMITYTYKNGHKVVKYSWNAIRNGRKVMEAWNIDKTKPLACPSLNDEFYNLLIMQGRMMPEDQVRFRLLYKDYNQISTNRREAVEKIADLGLMNGYFIPTKGDKPIYGIYDWKTNKKLIEFNPKYDPSKNLVYFYPQNVLKETEFTDIKNRLKNESLRLCDDELRFNFITDYELRFHHKNPILRIYDVRTVYYFKNIINTTKNDKELIIYNILTIDGYLGNSFESKQLQKTYFIPYPLP